MLGFFMKGLTMNNTQIYNSINLLIHIFNNKKDFLNSNSYPIFENSKYFNYLIDNKLINKIDNLKTNKNYYSSDYKNNNKKKLKVLYYITLNENNIINWITKNNFVLRIESSGVSALLGFFFS